MAHNHDHAQEAHAPIEDHHEMTLYEKRAYAIESLLLEKGILTADAIRQKLEEIDAVTPALGARVVARAWVDAAFKARLLANAKEAIAELGIDTDALTTLVAVENTEKVHNVVVCTLCSCYPRAILGLPPDWYKSLSYRSRVVLIHAVCCGNLAQNCRLTSRCGSMTAQPTCATWSSPSARRAPSTCARRNWLNSSRATA